MLNEYYDCNNIDVPVGKCSTTTVPKEGKVRE